MNERICVGDRLSRRAAEAGRAAAREWRERNKAKFDRLDRAGCFSDSPVVLRPRAQSADFVRSADQ